MRPIKFRFWDEDKKQMFGVIAIPNSFKGETKPLVVDIDDDGIYRPEKSVLEQYTDLTDKNGVEIYEGDIVHGYDQEPDRGDGYIGSSVIEVVNFKHGAFWIGDSWYKVTVMTPPIVEVIGNIHENPELLEE